MKRLLTTIAMLVAWTGTLSAGERDVVKPMIGDKLIPVRLTQQEMRGGEIDRRITELIYRNYMVLDLDRAWACLRAITKCLAPWATRGSIIYTSFRVAPSPRMNRLLADRGSYWIGGAYCGTELPWESIGYFRWQPTASVNTFRFDWGMRTFGDTTSALAFASFSNAYENLWDVFNVDLLPYHWHLKMASAQRSRSAVSGLAWLGLYRDRLNKLKTFASAKQTKVSVSDGDQRIAPDAHAPQAVRSHDRACQQRRLPLDPRRGPQASARRRFQEPGVA